MSHQDWTPVVINKTVKKGTGTASEQEINQARRRGDQVDTVKKFMGGQNKATKSPVPNAAKLDEDTGDYHVDRVSFDFAKALQQARLEKKMTQAQLAQQVNEKASVINDYESGKAIPNGALVSRLNKILGARLPSAKQPKKKVEDEP
ncbi:uncharacterized protein LOC129617953 [Condylostylus longicornis]|uniref:uncharacterized protein LOC129617953 n=1 Tax=Condylostylus longicornis TaxID=2530218 RepID=UPI00244DB193|nr:uncharacterized protein LOC129617953 [Condylostylus longicornis]